MFFFLQRSFLSEKNSVDNDEMLYHTAFYLGSPYCCQSTHLGVTQVYIYTKDLMSIIFSNGSDMFPNYLQRQSAEDTSTSFFLSESLIIYIVTYFVCASMQICLKSVILFVR